MKFTANGFPGFKRALHAWISARRSSGGALGQGGDGAEPAGVGYRRREGGVSDVMHAPLDDRVLDLEQLCDPGLENHDGRRWLS